MMSTKKTMSKKMKKQDKKIKTTSISTNNEIKNMTIILGIVTAVVLIFYGITYLVTNKDKKVEKEETKIQYSEILAGTMFQQKEETYYVLALDEEDVAYPLYSAYLNLISSGKGTPYYIVNLDNVFNKKYKGETSNITTDFKSLSFSDATVVKVTNGQVAESYVGKDAIVAYFDSLLGK